MEDFLLSAIDFLQEDLQPEEFLTAVLGEIQKKILLQHASGDASVSFTSKALTEVRRRVEEEKNLRAEVARLSQVLLHAEQSERSLQEEISRIKHQHALDLDEGNKKVCGSVEVEKELRAEICRLSEGVLRAKQSEHCLQEEISRIERQHALDLDEGNKKVCRSVEVEKELRAEIDQLSKAAQHAEQSKCSMQEDISRVKHQHALDLSEENKKLLLLTEQWDFARAGEQDAKNALDQTRKNHDQLESSLRAEISQLKVQHAITCADHTSALQFINQQHDATLQSERKCHKAVKEKGQRDLSKLTLQNLELDKEVNRLQKHNRDLEQQISALKKQKFKSPTVRRSQRGHANEDEQSDSDLDSSSSEYRSEPVGKGKAAAQKSQNPPDRGLPDDILTLLDDSICEERRKPLDESKFDGFVPEREEITIFNRSLLSAQLGGGKISLRVNIAPGNKKPLAQRLGISSYVCPNLDHNPWAPASPGKAGFMFVGLGNEQDAFATAEKHEMFVQFAPKRMFYAGRYLCQKVGNLGPEEWAALDDKVKHKYCETTDSKTNKSREKCKSRVETIRSEYNEGTRRVPCVLLECIDYNWDLYNALADASKLVNVTPLHCTAGTSSHTSNSKRKRTIKGLYDSGPETPVAHETVQVSKKARNMVQETPPNKEEEIIPEDMGGSTMAGNSDKNPIIIDCSPTDL